MNDFYVLIHLELNLIICPVMKLPKDWCNISGLNLLSYEKIYDLEWAGHKDLSWRKLSDIPDEFSGSKEWLDISKLILKNYVSDDIEGKIDDIQDKEQLISFVDNINK
mgnify:CR=1 FL=1